MVKVSLCLSEQAPCHEDVWGNGGIPQSFMVAALDEGEWSASRLGKEPPAPLG
jgi:hypothetical protein